MWSRSYPCCRCCGSSDLKHMAKGLCSRCYLKAYNNDPDNRERQRRHKLNWYRRQDPERYKQYREQTNFSGKRDAVLRRDGFKCRVCGATDNLVVHHSDGNGRGTKTPNNDIRNLVTLCRRHHAEAHSFWDPKLKWRRGIDGWAKKYAKCSECGTTKVKHAGHGLCANCCARNRHRLLKSSDDIVRPRRKLREAGCEATQPKHKRSSKKRSPVPAGSLPTGTPGQPRGPCRSSLRGCRSDALWMRSSSGPATP
jgi:hypothetical protein